MKRLLVLLLLAPWPAKAEPPLWVAHGPHATVYLFGSLHLVRPDTAWDGPSLRRAAAEADRLVFEMVVPDDPAALAPLVLSRGLDPSHPLPEKLTPADAGRLQAAAKRAAVPGGPDSLNAMRPWLAAVVLAADGLQRAGLTAEGPDMVLQRDAKAAGKPVDGFETAAQQLGFIADLPEPVALRLLLSTLDSLDELPRQFGAVIAAWEAGDIGPVAAMLSKPTAEPELYKAMFADRNTAWSRAIRTMLDGNATVLVTVGAGHLAGPGNVRELLERDGIRVERVGDGK